MLETETAIQVDGVPTDAAWIQACSLPMIMRAPVFGEAPSEQTDVRLVHDGIALYVLARLYDRRPNRVRANSLYRDRYGDGDRFGILIDTFNDNTTGLYFWTTPAGIRGDAAVSNDGIETNVDPINDNWNAHWTVATQQTDDGWVAELRIPFGSLGFQSDGGRTTMGVIATRTIAWKNELQIFPAIDPGQNVLTPSHAQDLVFRSVRAERPIYVTPYLLGGANRIRNEKSEIGTDPRFDVGIDLRYDVTNNLTLDVTANTDFAQVEADEVRVNLSRFSLFFPEKRQFFQERSGLFQFSTRVFGPDRLFYSRRIGLAGGTPVPILVGAKLVGRTGPWDIGVMNLQTARQGSTPAENFGVARLRRTLFNKESTVGALATSRIGPGGNYNVTYGLDADVRLAGPDYLTVKWAQTLEDGAVRQHGFEPWATSLVQLQFERRRRRGFNYLLTATRSGADFRPEMGFVQRTDFTELGWYGSYDWILGSETSLRLLSPLQVFGFVVLRNPDHSLESALFEWNTDTEWDAGIRVSTDVEWHVEDLRASLELPNATRIPAARYHFWTVNASVETPPGRAFQGEVGGSGSTFYDGRRWDVELEAQWNASRHLQIASEYQFTRARFPNLRRGERTPGFDAHVARMRIQSALNIRFSADAFVQYASTADRLALNTRIRYNFGEGRDLWLVYDERLDVSHFGRAATRPISDARSLTLKMTYTFGV